MATGRAAGISRRLSLPDPSKDVGGRGRPVRPSVDELSKTGAMLASYRVEGTLQLDDVIDSNSDVMTVRFDPDGNHVAAGYADGTLKVYEVATGQCVHTLADDDTRSERLPVTSVKYCPGGQTTNKSSRKKNLLLATYASGKVKMWHWPSERCQFTIDEDRQSLASTFNHTGQRFLTAGADPQIHQYDVETQTKVVTMRAREHRTTMDGHRARVFTLMYHPRDTHVFLSGGWDNTVQFWDDRETHAVRKFFGPHICGDSLDIDAVHGQILTGSWRKECALQLWDFGTGVKICDVPNDMKSNSMLYCAQWLGNNNMMCAGSDRNVVRVVDRNNLNTIGLMSDLAKGVYSIDNDRQDLSQRVAVASGHSVYIVRNTPQQPQK